METPAVTPAVRKGFFRRFMSWRGVLFLLAAFITLVALLLAEENWRGGRAWQNYKREMEAKGERFDAARLIPPKVPDGQNLGMLPYFTSENADAGPMTGLTNQFSWPNLRHSATWRYGLAADLIEWTKAFHGPGADPVQAASTVLDYLNKHEPVLAELEAARQRPDCRFNIHYEDWGNLQVDAALIQQLARIKPLIRVLCLRAQAEMVSGRTDQAIDDINLMFRIDDGLKDEPLLISQLVRLAGVAIMLQPIGEGLAEHRWSEAQLRILQERLQKTDLIASIVQSFHGERDICVNQSFDHGNLNTYGLGLFPRGWVRLEQLRINRACHDMLFPRIDLSARKISPSVNHSIDLAFKKFAAGNWYRVAFIQHSLFAKMLLPALSGAVRNTAFAQSEVDMAMLACALERYRLAEGQYPEELNALVPRFVTVLPHDIINGQPLKYRRTDNGRFILYSVGWNEKDDGGVVATNKEKRQDVLQGDWVWQYPEGN
jgi:hypothetical protein